MRRGIFNELMNARAVRHVAEPETLESYTATRASDDIYAASLIEGRFMMDTSAKMVRRERGIEVLFIGECIGGSCRHDVFVKYKNGTSVDEVMDAETIRSKFILCLYHPEREHFGI